MSLPLDGPALEEKIQWTHEATSYEGNQSIVWSHVCRPVPYNIGVKGGGVEDKSEEKSDTYRVLMLV